jgi:hypothetical protein
MPGTARGTDPVARMIVFALSSSSPTRTVPASVSVALPATSSILFFLNNPETPPVSVSTTLSRRSMTAPKSTVGSPTRIPKSPASRISLSTSAARRTALAGMQATFRQRPPTLSRSTTAVLMPSCAARIAAT